jgi:methionine aminopeptidase
MDFRLKDGEKVRTCKALKASGTVLEAGDLVELSSGLIIKATTTAAAVAWCPNGGADGETEVDVTVGNDFSLKGTGDGVFADAYKGTEVDLAGTTNQVIDVTGGTTYKVLKFGIDKDTGVVGSTDNITVRINKPLF